MTDAGDPIPAGRPRRRWLLPTALVVSVAANLFLGSILVGQFTHQRTQSELGVFQSFRRFTETMPKETREIAYRHRIDIGHALGDGCGHADLPF